MTTRSFIASYSLFFSGQWIRLQTVGTVVNAAPAAGPARWIGPVQWEMEGVVCRLNPKARPTDLPDCVGQRARKLNRRRRQPRDPRRRRRAAHGGGGAGVMARRRVELAVEGG